MDCADSECANAPVCQTSSEAELCDDKVDYADGKDCNGEPVCSGGSGTAEVCDDGIDNDGDGKTDCADRKDCGRDPACQPEPHSLKSQQGLNRAGPVFTLQYGMPGVANHAASSRKSHTLAPGPVGMSRFV
ncbi:MAG TPA: hypothetical protein VET88_07700 [Gammaproteobacteria bacterium]|nr:hypothetical protein [Gammaproteobacteria bacterium]